jgi:peptidyl-prolyl cis-trans isomerase SurA
MIAAVALGAAAAGWPAPAAAQVVVVVNGDPITAWDIEQRSKLVEVSTHKAPTRQEVLDELINERLEIKEAKKYTLEASDTDVDNAYASMAGRMHVSVAQLTEILGKQGILPDTLKMRIRAELVWGQLVKGRYQSTLQIGEKDILGAMASDKPGEAPSKDAVGYEYKLRPILFIVPHGSAPAVFEERKKEAEALRARFQSCDDGLNFAKVLRDTAVREPVIKNVADLPEQLRGVLEGTALGHLTPPEITKEGVETFAVCSKRETTSDSPEKRAARDKIFASRYQAQAQRYLQEVRRGAMIEYR